MTADPHESEGLENDGLRRFATIWSRAVYPATQTSMTRAELGDYLHPLAVKLCDALHAYPFSAAPGREVGAALVAAHCTSPDALPHILGVVDSYLVLYGRDPETSELPVDEARARCSRLQHAVAAGFTEALRDRTLAEQEALSRAALAAQSAVEEALHASETRFRAVFKDATIGISIADMDGRIRDANGAIARMFKRSEEEMRRRNVNEWVHPDDAPDVWRMHRQLVRGERDHFRVEKPFHRPDGTVLWTNLTVSLLRDADGEPRYQLALLEDITERRLLHLRLRYEATHDELTGLPNRTLFAERLDRLLSASSDVKRFGLCYLDIDGFKAVNDSLGHAVGDQLLIAVAERLQSCTAGSGHLVARIGGDEFAALCTDPSGPEDVTELARQVLAALATPIRIDGRELSVRASIGIVEGPSGELRPEEVMRSADITMYRAKDAGGSRYELADPDSDARAIDRHSLTTRLPAALEWDEFFLEYQPLIRMSDGQVEGAEALVRWKHPVHGRLGPDRFIPLAEHTGLIVPLGRWVMEQAVRQACAWHEERSKGSGDGKKKNGKNGKKGEGLAERPLRVNVNLSPRQLHHPDLVPDTIAVLEAAGMPPSSLCLEVTESALIGADEDELKPLRQLAELGVEIALDDFGTGYSNLANLRRLPATTLKLDRSFTQGLQQHPADPVDVTFVEGIVTLAHALGLAVTVEGVETGHQAAQLRDMGCDTAQGWYYARPGPASTFVQGFAVT
ncbi:PAS domain S-box-containing protein/diguanylate cyclase (GGDEF) domain-containing protein [Streptomyces sp. WMMB 714]|uniref:putative bifunctional diguanylate cyclase/phosphodiesterase n=1 Tax=Streptomyces sp. WMMB 714 TaxID=1286822 RepID=UPI0005F8175E|nr:EAL domain-containing protein [Streptomyces sp. WMMB 714]SCK32819.1 PAS domain S-box-containing protein/diguanylate cyclase (GGDEF) domain-containing protein [Streptomyces sp. WMMB 714]